MEQEGTASTFRALREVVARHGLFCSLYTDRGSHYFFTPQVGGKVSKTALTQVGRGLSQLGIEHIAAYSPQARGRSERVFHTLQDRLPKEFKLAGIDSVEAANIWLRDSFIPEHDKRFAVDAEQEGSAFVADATGAWREILCIQEDRTVGQDNTVRWAGLSLQLPPSRLRSRRWCGCMNILTVAWRCSGVRTGWVTTTLKAGSSSRRGLPHDTLPCRLF